MFKGSFDNFDSSKTLTTRPLIFRKPKIEQNCHTVNHVNIMM